TTRFTGSGDSISRVVKGIEVTRLQYYKIKPIHVRWRGSQRGASNFGARIFPEAQNLARSRLGTRLRKLYGKKNCTAFRWPGCTNSRDGTGSCGTVFHGS